MKKLPDFEKIKGWIKKHRMLILQVQDKKYPNHKRYRILTRTQGLYFFMAGPDARRFSVNTSCWFNPHHRSNVSMTQKQWNNMLKHDEREALRVVRIHAMAGQKLWSIR